MDDFYDKQKEVHGKWATFVWIGSGVYLFATVDAASLLSWQAAVYFVVGMFAAALAFGAIAYLLQRILAMSLAKIVRGPSRGAASAITMIGLVFSAVEAVVIFLVARWIVEDVLFA